MREREAQRRALFEAHGAMPDMADNVLRENHAVLLAICYAVIVTTTTAEDMRDSDIFMAHDILSIVTYGGLSSAPVAYNYATRRLCASAPRQQHARLLFMRGASSCHSA